MIKRLQKLAGLGKESCFLWGARQTGKSTLLKQLFPEAMYYDLLLSDEFERLNRQPQTMRQEILAAAGKYQKKPIVIIDEVQKVPALLDEAQWLIVNHGIQFILCGSSARKLKRAEGNLLGGRAVRFELYPFVYKEIPNFDLMKALNGGLLPRHYLSERPRQLIHAYIGDYLQQEIAAEALTRNIPAFGKFLESAAFSNGEIINYRNIASECGISAPTVKEYFQILEDTLIANFIPSYQKRPKRRVIQSPKFYFFDLGIANFLLKRGEVRYKSELFGRVFEHFIFQELIARSHYSGINYSISYWRTASQIEVDFVLGDHEVIIEVKVVDFANTNHCRNLKAFQEEYKVKKSVVVSLDPRPRLLDSVNILPWNIFLDDLWAGKII